MASHQLFYDAINNHSHCASLRGAISDSTYTHTHTHNSGNEIKQCFRFSKRSVSGSFLFPALFPVLFCFRLSYRSVSGSLGDLFPVLFCFRFFSVSSFPRDVSGSFLFPVLLEICFRFFCFQFS